MALQGASYSLTALTGLHSKSIGFCDSNTSIQCSSVSSVQACERKPSRHQCLVSAREGLRSNIWATNSQLRIFRTCTMRATRVLQNVTTPALTVKALQGKAPRRLVDVLRAIPKISKAYFKSPFRRALYGGIALLGGFYIAQTISLSFGALGVNDVIAAALCVLFAEYITKFYHSRVRVTFSVALLNNFKMGFTYGLFIDAFKLAS